jgi:hypothetical protein
MATKPSQLFFLNNGEGFGSTYGLPRASRPTRTMAILPEWNSLAEVVLFRIL